MELNSVNNVPLQGMRPSVDSVSALSVQPSRAEPVMANAVKAMEEAEKANTGKKATDQPYVEATRLAGEEKQKLDKEQLTQSLGKLYKASGLQFSVDDELGRTVVKVLDPETREVLKQIPTEEALALSRALHGEKGSLHSAQA